MQKQVARSAHYLSGLLLATAVSVGMVIAGSFFSQQLLYTFLIWNLFLAWLPLVFALWLRDTLRTKLWSSWQALALTVVWLTLLPNSFYMVSDFVHLNEVSNDQIVFASIVFASFVFTSAWLGVSSLYVVHHEILKRTSERVAGGVIAGLLLVSSLAIYIGRDLRWNSWDILLNPFGLLFDLSERLLHPSQWPQVLAVVVPFFILLGTIYYVSWQTIRLMRNSHL